MSCHLPSAHSRPKNGYTAMPSQETVVSVSHIRDSDSMNNITRDYASVDPMWLNNVPATQVFVRYDPRTESFSLNGKCMPRLLLTKGKKYSFNVVTNGHLFGFFSKDGNNLTYVPPSDYNKFVITIDCTLPEEFYYGSKDGIMGHVKLV